MIIITFQCLSRVETSMWGCSLLTLLSWLYLLMGNFSPSFKFKICQKFKISQPKVINCSLLGDFCLANFKFLAYFKFKTRWETGHWTLEWSVKKCVCGGEGVSFNKKHQSLVRRPPWRALQQTCRLIGQIKYYYYWRHDFLWHVMTVVIFMIDCVDPKSESWVQLLKYIWYQVNDFLEKFLIK